MRNAGNCGVIGGSTASDAQCHGQRKGDDGDRETCQRIAAPQSADMTFTPNNDELRCKCLKETLY